MQKEPAVYQQAVSLLKGMIKIGAWQDMDHLLSVMNGMGGEITDREAFAAVTKAVWLMMDCTVRGIDKTEDKNG